MSIFKSFASSLLSSVSNFVEKSINSVGMSSFAGNQNNDKEFGDNEFGDNDDFIPFEPLHQPIIHIEVKVQPFQLSEEDKNCCVCMETRETHQICQLNCLHKFCSECIKIHIQRNRQESCCPLCRINITEISVQTEEICETFI